MAKGWDILTRNGTFTARIRVTGHKSRSRTYDTRAEAENWAKVVVAKILVGDPTVTGGDEPFKVWLQRYHDFEASKWATVKDKQRRLKEMLTLPIANIPVRLCTPSDFERLRDWLLKERPRPLSPQSVRHYLEDCSAVWSAARTKWKVTKLDNPLLETEIPPVSEGRRSRVRVDARDAIFGELRQAKNPFYQPYAEFLYETSLRAAEPLGLRFADVDLEGQVAHLKVKGGKVRPLPLSARAVQLIEEARAIRAGGRKLSWGHYDIDDYDPQQIWPVTYIGFKRGWDVARVAAGYPTAIPHDLRRERSNMMLEAKWSIPEVQVMTGHKDAKTLGKHYLVIEAGRIAKAMGPAPSKSPAPAAARPSFAARVRAAQEARRLAPGSAGVPAAPRKRPGSSDPA